MRPARVARETPGRVEAPRSSTQLSCSHPHLLGLVAFARQRHHARDRAGGRDIADLPAAVAEDCCVAGQAKSQNAFGKPACRTRCGCKGRRRRWRRRCRRPLTQLPKRPPPRLSPLAGGGSEAEPLASGGEPTAGARGLEPSPIERLEALVVQEIADLESARELRAGKRMSGAGIERTAQALVSLTHTLQTIRSMRGERPPATVGTPDDIDLDAHCLPHRGPRRRMAGRGGQGKSRRRTGRDRRRLAGINTKIASHFTGR